MSLQERIAEELKGSMKAGDTQRTSTLRLLRSQIVNEGLKRKVAELSDDDVLRVIAQEAKKRQEAAAEFRTAGRADSAASEDAEYAILAVYLPAQLSDEDIEGHVRDVVKETGATDVKAMGKVMPQVLARVKGAADGKRVRAIVERVLASV